MYKIKIQNQTKRKASNIYIYEKGEVKNRDIVIMQNSIIIF